MKIDSSTQSVYVSGDASAFVIEDATAALKECKFPAESSEALGGSYVPTTAVAQPQREEQAREGGPREGGPREGGRQPMPNPIIAALDTDGDHVISAKEIQNATASLLSLDKNKDGKLTNEEIHPARPDGGPEGRGPEGRGPEGRPSPERFVEEAMQFDANGDKMLDREELTKFAEEMGNRQGRPPEGGPGRGAQGGQGGDRGRGGAPEGDRPRRPAIEE